MDIRKIGITKNKILAAVSAVVISGSFLYTGPIYELQNFSDNRFTNVILNISGGFQESINAFGLLSCILLLVFFKLNLYYVKQELEKKFWDVVLAGCFSAFMVFGKTFMLYDSWKGINQNYVQLFWSVFTLLGYYRFFVIVIRLIYNYFETTKRRKRHTYALLEKFDAHIVRNSFLLIFICWLPYVIAFFPGVIVWDGLRSLTYYFGKVAWSNHHPYFISCLMGFLMEIGQKIFKSDQIGFFFYTFGQTLFSCWSFAYFIGYLKKTGASRKLYLGSLVYFALFTVWPDFSYNYLKDMLYCSFLLHFAILLHGLSTKRTNYSKWNYIRILLVSVMVCLTRNNGIYVVGAAFFLWCCFDFLSKKRIAAKKILVKNGMAFILLCLFWVGYTHWFLPSQNVFTGEKQEMLSIPLQQTARYARDAAEDVTDEEREAISKVLRDYGTIAEDYNPELSDDVKNRFINDASAEDFKGYLKAWFCQFQKHPGIYMQATINNIYGYFYPEKESWYEGVGNYFMVYSDPVNPDNYLSYGFMEWSEGFRSLIREWAYFWRNIPGFGILYSCGIYTWVLFIGLGAVLRERAWRHSVIFVPGIMTLLVNIASPVNAYIRYTLPMMAMTPLWIMEIGLIMKERYEKPAVAIGKE